MMLAMNALHYDAMAVGNHEYNFGLQVLEKARREARVPWLSANTYNNQVKGDPTNYYKPYIIKRSAGRAHWRAGIDDARHSEVGEPAELRRA